LQRDAFASARSLSVEIGRHRVVVTLTERGPFAYADRCPHRGAPMLAGGRIVTPLVPGTERLVPGRSESHVRCPWHKWDYDLETGRCAVDPRLRLRTYPAWIDGDEVVVSIDATRSTTEDQ
jgi:3-phenylpropionate/trans-cinnamate dioxygenase ferredoxin subunit